MELKDYFKIIKQSLAVIIALFVLGGLGGYLWAKKQPIKYETSASAVVDKPSTAAAAGETYRYDKYYALQASGLFADSLAAWLSSPSGVHEAYEKAGLPVPEISLKKLSQTFRVNREPTSSLVVSIVDTDQSRSEKLANAAMSALEEQLTAQRSDEDPDQFFTLAKNQVVTGKVKASPAVNSVLGALGGLILGLIYAFGRAYLKD